MNDIDFDELDRAVASALGTTPPASASQEAPQEDRSVASASSTSATPAVRQSEITAATFGAPNLASRSKSSSIGEMTSSRSISSGRETPVSPLGRRTIVRRRDEAATPPAQDSPEFTSSSVDTSTESTEPIETHAPETEQPNPVVVGAPKKRIIPHRSGRVMDVVASKPKSSRSISRVAATVSPIGAASAAPPDNTETPVIADVLPPSLANETPDLSEDNFFKSNEFAELEKGATSSADSKETEVTPEETLGNLDPMPYETELTTFDETMAKQLAQPLPQETAISPFLSDAKVEKRPLGGSEQQAPESFEESVADDFKDVSTDVSAPMSHATPPIGSTTPAELDRDVVAIESQELDIPDPRKDPQATASVPTKKPSMAPTTTGPTAITRQYKEAPRVASEHDESGAIFDPQTYHVEVSSPQKRSFGWGWVIALVSIILLAVVFAVLAWMEGVLPVPL